MLGKKAQFDLGEFEFNPIAAAAGVLGGLVSMFVMSQVQVGIIYKIGGFLATTIVCYFMFDKISQG